MSNKQPTSTSGDRTRQALVTLAELTQKYPAENRKTLLQQVEIQFDLTPKECDFLQRNFVEPE